MSMITVRGWHVLLEPAHDACGVVDRRREFADTMTLLGICDENRSNSIGTQGVVKLRGLGGRGAAVERTTDVQRRGLHFACVHDGTALKVLAARIVVTILGKEDSGELGNVREKSSRDSIRDR